LRFYVGMSLIERTEVVVYLRPPYTFTVIRETATSSIPFALIVTTAYTTYIPITTTVRETTTATAVDWTSTAVIAVILLVVDFAIGYIVKRR